MLSAEQQNAIENSIWVVNTALKNQGLSADEDMRQNAILYMCKCIQRFDPSRNIKWTTYAYENVYLYIRRLHKRQLKRANWEIDEETYTLQATEMPLEEPELLDENKMMIERLKAHCTPKERRFIDLKLQGYKGTEIGKIMGCSISKVSMYMRNIKDKARGEERYL